MSVPSVDERRGNRRNSLARRVCKHSALGQHSHGKDGHVHPASPGARCAPRSFSFARVKAHPLSEAVLTLWTSPPFSSPEARILACLTSASSSGPFQPPTPAPALSDPSHALLPSAPAPPLPPPPSHLPSSFLPPLLPLPSSPLPIPVLGLRTVPNPGSSRRFQ